MTCDLARELIALTRPGETSETETRALAEHLMSCATCAQLYRDALSLNEKIAALREVEPVLEDPQGLLRQVMQIVDATSWPQLRGMRPGRVPVLRALLRPGHSAPLRVRSLAFACASMLVAVFLVQTTLDARKLAALELRLGRITVGTAVAGIAEPGQLLGLLPSGEARDRLAATVRSGGLRNTLNEEEVRSYVESLHREAGTTPALPLRTGLLQKVTPSDRAEIAKAIDTLLLRGGNVHEH